MIISSQYFIIQNYLGNYLNILSRFLGVLTSESEEFKQKKEE